MGGAPAGERMANQPLLEVRGIRKRFPGVLALDDVHLRLYPSEVLAVIGENGAGKSTLMKILGGVLTPDAGEILIEGRPVVIDSVATATRLGIALIHQELNLADNLDIAENVFLGREPSRGGPLQWVDRHRLYRDTQRILQRLGMNLSPKTLVGDLPIGQQQMVEIAKAFSINARILIMDEPTSSLSQHEAEQLFRVIRELKSQGVSVLYISHRLGEVKQIADRVSVLRDGRHSGELAREEIEYERMVKLMVGRDIREFYFHRGGRARSLTAPMVGGNNKKLGGGSATRPTAVLEVRNLRLPHAPTHPLSFTLHAGEILGLAGLVGAGRTELAHALFGIEQPVGGAIYLNGEQTHIGSPREAIRAGIALVPEDRKLQGLILEMAVQENITLAGLGQWWSDPVMRRGQVRKVAQHMVQQLAIRTPSLEQLVQFLSGGNQQKVVLAKWLCLQPRVLLLDEPTRGVDVGAKQEIYRLMEQLAAEGVAILMISSEMQEILSVPDRVLVMHQGRIMGELKRDELSEEAVMELATGGRLE